jgi:uncharacterized protein with FMN-binding domain
LLLKQRTRTNISLVLFIALLLVSAGVWSMRAPAQEGPRDGVYFGSAQGFMGELGVDVTIEGGRITAIDVRPHQETPFIADPALETLVDEILAAQSTEVDIVSGATYTSQALLQAVEQAIGKASISYTDGVHTGTAEGFGGKLVLEVTVAGGAITAIEIVEEYETPFIAQDAFEQLPEAIIAAQSWEVDIVSGATVTSKAIMAAVEDALTE